MTLGLVVSTLVTLIQSQNANVGAIALQYIQACGAASPEAFRDLINQNPRIKEQLTSALQSGSKSNVSASTDSQRKSKAKKIQLKMKF